MTVPASRRVYDAVGQGQAQLCPVHCSIHREFIIQGHEFPLLHQRQRPHRLGLVGLPQHALENLGQCDSGNQETINVQYWAREMLGILVIGNPAQPGG